MVGRVLNGSVIICGIIECAISDPTVMPPLARFFENWEYLRAKPSKNHYLGKHQRTICDFFRCAFEGVLSKWCLGIEDGLNSPSLNAKEFQHSLHLFVYRLARMTTCQRRQTQQYGLMIPVLIQEMSANPEE
jgi:hypothetical protein